MDSICCSASFALRHGQKEQADLIGHSGILDSGECEIRSAYASTGLPRGDVPFNSSSDIGADSCRCEKATTFVLQITFSINYMTRMSKSNRQVPRIPPHFSRRIRSTHHVPASRRPWDIPAGKEQAGESHARLSIHGPITSRASLRLSEPAYSGPSCPSRSGPACAEGLALSQSLPVSGVADLS